MRDSNDSALLTDRLGWEKTRTADISVILTNSPLKHPTFQSF